MDELVQQVEAAEHRLLSARRAPSRLWQLRHMRGALEHLVEAVRSLEADEHVVLEARGAPVRAGRW